MKFSNFGRNSVGNPTSDDKNRQIPAIFKIGNAEPGNIGEPGNRRTKKQRNATFCYIPLKKNKVLNQMQTQRIPLKSRKFLWRQPQIVLVLPGPTYNVRITILPAMVSLPKRPRKWRHFSTPTFIGVREGGAGGLQPPPQTFENHYLFRQKLSCHSGNDGLVIRRTY